MSEPYVVQGKTVLITGAAKRLGAALAWALHQAGARLVLHCHASRQEADMLAEAIRVEGGAAQAVQADLMSEQETDALVDRAVALAGPIDILINNASIFEDIAFAETGTDDILRNMTIHAAAPLLIARRFAAQCQNGVILNLLDAMVCDYDRKHVPYHLSKRTLQTLTRIMAVEFAPGIRVNAVAPGLILPPPGMDAAYLEKLAHSNPLNRYGAARDIVDAALYLLGAPFVTGQTVYVDGGRHLRGAMYE